MQRTAPHQSIVIDQKSGANDPSAPQFITTCSFFEQSNGLFRQVIWAKLARARHEFGPMTILGSIRSVSQGMLLSEGHNPGSCPYDLRL
jgi:hypothetical protein